MRLVLGVLILLFSGGCTFHAHFHYHTANEPQTELIFDAQDHGDDQREQDLRGGSGTTDLDDLLEFGANRR